MAKADKGGRVAQVLGDQIACLGMDIYESIQEAAARFAKDFPELAAPPTSAPEEA